MFQIATFTNCRNTTATMVEVADWSEFVLLLADLPHVPADKWSKLNASPAISPAIYEPGATRLDANVRGWSNWMGIDIDNDLLITPIHEAEEVMQALGLSFLIYSTTKATASAPRYRILFPTTRALSVEEIKPAWTAMAAYFAALGPDANCKDLSRLYMAPAFWLPGRAGQAGSNLTPLNEFRFRLDGEPLDIDAVMAAYVPPVVSAQPIQASPAREFIYPTANKALPATTSIGMSPVVKTSFVDEYLSLGKGEHHKGLFRFLCKVLGMAKMLGYDITDTELIHYARELDTISPIKTDPDRRVEYEVRRARNFTHSP